MSYDIYVFTQQRPTADQVRNFLTRHPAASVVGSPTDGHNLLVDAQADGWVFTIDRPEPFDMEDSGLDPEDEAIRQRLNPLPAWDTFIAVPYFRDEHGLEIAFDLAFALARENAGWVWDPQTEELTGSRSEPARDKPYRINLPDINPTDMG